jgi:hypothetical protein
MRVVLSHIIIRATREEKKLLNSVLHYLGVDACPEYRGPLRKTDNVREDLQRAQRRFFVCAIEIFGRVFTCVVRLDKLHRKTR